MRIVHAVVRLRRHRARARSSASAITRRCSAGGGSTLDTSVALPRQRAAADDAASSCRCARCVSMRPSAGRRSRGCGSRLLLAAFSRRTPARRRRHRSQPHRFPDRDVQAHEDAVMEEPRFDPLDYVSVFNRRKWWFIVPVDARRSSSAGCWSGCCRAATRRRRRSRQRTARRAEPGRRGGDRSRRAHARHLAAAAQPPVLERTARLEHLDQNRIDRRGGQPAARRHLACRCPTRSRRRRQAARRARSSRPSRRRSSTATRCVYIDASPERRAADRQPRRAGLRRREQPVAGAPRAGHVRVHRRRSCGPARTRLNRARRAAAQP